MIFLNDLCKMQRALRKGKGWLYERGIKVPLIIRWNKKIKEKPVDVKYALRIHTRCV